MDTTEFRAYKKRYRASIREILASAERDAVVGAAFPAYSHYNPLIDWLFWQRLREVFEFVERRVGGRNRALDFGCGGGVTLPFLAREFRDVVAMDIDLRPLTLLRKWIPVGDNVQLVEAQESTLGELGRASFDVVLALDVLEHLPDVKSVMTALVELLTPEGRLIVCGPTENIFYRIGRKVAGPQFSGEYHERGIDEILKVAEEIGVVTHIATLVRPCPFFEIFAVARRGSR